MSDIAPLTPDEVDMLERGFALRYVDPKQWLATVRARERRTAILANVEFKVREERDELQRRYLAQTTEQANRIAELQRQLAEFKNGNAYSKLGGQLAEVSQERHRLERELAEARKDTEHAAREKEPK